jgi:hypothetical protein
MSFNFLSAYNPARKEPHPGVGRDFSLCSK